MNSDNNIMTMAMIMAQTLDQYLSTTVSRADNKLNIVLLSLDRRATVPWYYYEL